ncbi:hypothetical protein Pmar_PMAR001485, partial [Perkinsus marinus ATCC 50983]
MSLGSLVTYFQLIALFSEIGFDWSTEVSTLLDLAKLSLFNFDILRLACFMEGPHQSLWRYIWLFYFVTRAFKVAEKSGMTYDKTVNMTGQVISVTLLAIVSTAVTPFKCYSHNDLGDRSLVRYPDVECGSDDHQ